MPSRHRLHGHLDIDFAFVSTSASHLPWHWHRTILTSASRSSWHRLRIRSDMDELECVAVICSKTEITATRFDIDFAVSWDRLRIHLDIGFAFALTSASHYHDIGFAFILTSASHSFWHRLRVLWELYWNDIRSNNKIMAIWPLKSFKQLFKKHPKTIKITSKSLPKTFPKRYAK